MFEIVEVEVQTGGDKRQVIEDRCATIALHTDKLGILNDFEYYRRTIFQLASAKGFDVVGLGDICNGGGKHLAFRHDIDADMVTAIRCADVLNREKLPGAFFPLHTSHYYGHFEVRDGKQTFIRHEGLLPLLRDLAETGCEIGIHNDALGVFLNYGINGTDLLLKEIAWLRASGIGIQSSVAHNSAAVYGAENFEIFNGLSVGGRAILEWEGKRVPLQSVDMQAVGLTYEGNHPRVRAELRHDLLEAIRPAGRTDLLRNPEWQKAYFNRHPIFRRGYDYDVWLIGEDQWIIAGHGMAKYPLTLTQLTEILANMAGPLGVVATIHPIYVGRRKG